LPIAAIQNNVGRYITPSATSLCSEVQSLLIAAPGFVDPDGSALTEQDIYPLGGLYWMVVAREQADEDRAKVLTDFLYWFLTERDNNSLDIALFSPIMQQVAVAQLEAIQWSGRPVFEAPQRSQRIGFGKVSQQQFHVRQRDAQVLIAGIKRLQPIIATYQNILCKGSIIYEEGELASA
jgi:hypothetical protein